MTGVVVLAMLAATVATSPSSELSLALDDGIVAQSVDGLADLSSDVRASYLGCAASGSVDTMRRESDDLVVGMLATSFLTTSDECEADYRAHLEEERKKQEEAERKRAEEARKAQEEEEAARIEAERQQGGGQSSQTESASGVGDDIAWLAAHVSCGASDISEAVVFDGTRSGDVRCSSLYRVMDAVFSANGVIFDECDDADVTMAVLAAVADSSIVTSGDAQGAYGELCDHMASSPAYVSVDGALMPGDVLVWSGHVGIYVGEQQAHDACGNTSSRVLATDGPATYPWLVPLPSSYDVAYRVVSRNGLGIDWESLAR